MENKMELINKYKPIKINAYLTISFWVLGIIIAIVGLVLTIIPGIGMDKIIENTENGNPTSKNIINKNGIIILSVMFCLGIISALFAQIFFPTKSKRYLQKINDNNYSILINYIARCYGSPFSGSIALLKQVDWIINYKHDSDKQFEEIQNYIDENTTRLQREKVEQEKIDSIYKNEMDANIINKNDLDNKKETILKKNNSKKSKNKEKNKSIKKTKPTKNSSNSNNK